jgi:hypothetical protein
VTGGHSRCRVVTPQYAPTPISGTRLLRCTDVAAAAIYQFFGAKKQKYRRNCDYVPKRGGLYYPSTGGSK